MALQAYTQSTTPVPYTQDSAIVFEMNNGNFSSCCPLVPHVPGGTTVTITRPGLYLVQYNGIAAATDTAGNITTTLYNTGTAVPYASASGYSGSDTENVSLAFSTYVRVMPSCASVSNQANLTVRSTGDDGSFYLNNLIVARVSN